MVSGVCREKEWPSIIVGFSPGQPGLKGERERVTSAGSGRERESGWRLNFRFRVPRPLRRGSFEPPDPGRGSAQTTFPRGQPTAHYDSDLRPTFPRSIYRGPRRVEDQESDQVEVTRSDSVQLIAIVPRSIVPQRWMSRNGHTITSTLRLAFVKQRVIY